MSNLRKVLASVLLGVIAVAGVTWWRGPADGTRRTMPKYDESAVLACQDFRRTISDAGSGSLTGPEFRARVETMHERARLADSAVAPGVADGVRVLLAAVTNGTSQQATQGIDLLRTACNGPGAKRD